MDWKAYELAQHAHKVGELGLLQTEHHPLDATRFRGKVEKLKLLVDGYLDQ